MKAACVRNGGCEGKQSKRSCDGAPTYQATINSLRTYAVFSALLCAKRFHVMHGQLKFWYFIGRKANMSAMAAVRSGKRNASNRYAMPAEVPSWILCSSALSAQKDASQCVGAMESSSASFIIHTEKNKVWIW